MSRVRDDVMWALAYNLAQSGEYAGWWDIEVELIGQEFSRARQLLDDEQIRERLDTMCAEARKDKPGDMRDVVALIDAAAPKLGRRGSYKKRNSN